MSTAPDNLDDGLAYYMDPVVDGDAADSFFAGDETDYELGDEVSDERTQETKNGQNKRKRSAAYFKLQEKKKLKMQIDIDRKKAVSTESSVEAIADYINESLRWKNPDISALELAEMYFKKTDFRSTAEFSEERTLENLPKFILGRFRNMLPTKQKNKDKKANKKDKKNNSTKPDSEVLQPSDATGRKFIAILSMSAIRACDVHRALHEIPGLSLKLINKNKIEVDLRLIKSTWSRVLCCTPGRLQKILATEDLPLKKREIKILIVDNSNLDQKMQNVFNIAETCGTLKSLTESGAKIYMY